MNSASPSMLESLVERICGLYSLPAVAMEVVRLSRSPKTDMSALASCLSKDPALTARLLQFVNSPTFGLKRKIGSIEEAVTVIGVRPLQSVVLGFSLPPKLVEGIEKRVLTRYWQHSLAKALAAREIARMTHAPDADEAFVSGLLQHLGMLAMVQELGGPYVDFVKQVWNEKGNLLQLEIASLGFDHRALSSRMVERWQFPDHLSRALAHPMQAELIARLDPSIRASAQRLHLAEHIARLLNEHDAIDWEMLVNSAKLHFSMEASEIETLMRLLDVQMKEVAPLFSLEWEEERTFEALLLESRELLVRLATDWIAPAKPLPTGESQSTKPAAESAAAKASPKVPESAMAPLTTLPSPNPTAALNRTTATPTTTTTHSVPASLSASALGSATALPTSAAISPASGMGLQTSVKRSMIRCRQQRWPLTLILISIDHWQMLHKKHSHVSVEAAALGAQKLCKNSLDPGDELVLVSDSQWGILLEDCDRSAATSVTRELHQRLRVWSESREAQGLFPVSFSLGVACVAMIAKNFEASDLIDRAEGCLSSAQLSGGDAFKTISV